MKKYIFLSVAAAAMMASCSNDEVDSPAMSPNNAIGFTAFTNHSSRTAANVVDKSNLSEFKLYGYMKKARVWSFNNQTVTANNGTCSYTPEQYWVKGESYKFFGVNPVTGLTLGTVTDGNNSFPTYTYTNDGQQDIVSTVVEDQVYYATDATQCPGNVNLTFNHDLTRIRFAFTTDATDANSNDALADPYYLGIQSVSFETTGNKTGAFNINNYDKTVDWTANTANLWGEPTGDNYTQVYAQDTWTTPRTGTQPTHVTAADGIVCGMSGESEAHTFIPFHAGTVTIKAAIMQNGKPITTDDNGNVGYRTFTVTIPATYTGADGQQHPTYFTMGNSYTLLANLNRSSFDMNCKINFTIVEVNDWNGYNDFNAGTLPQTQPQGN